MPVFVFIFRRSLWQQLVLTITPLLAEIFAFYDYNLNLNILKENPCNSWKYRLWLALASPKVHPLHYTSFVPPGDETEERKGYVFESLSTQEPQPRFREKAPVKGFGCGGLPFPALIPFSWLIKEYFDRWYIVASEKTGITRARVASIKA